MYSICSPIATQTGVIKTKIVPLGVDETYDGVIALYLCLNLIEQCVHRILTLNDILPKLTQIQYLTLIDASSGNNKL